MALPLSEPRDTVLVVDDSPETLSLVTDILEAAGMTALVATDGCQALSIVSRRLPDLVLLDAVMPGKDGFQVCRLLKRLPNASNLPVVFMTGLTEPIDQEAFTGQHRRPLTTVHCCRSLSPG